MFSGRKPYTAVSVQIDRMTDDQSGEDDLGGIINLVEVIRLQESGPTEAARAVRKKLKYGGPQQQIRALTILDGLIQNAGSRFQTTFADEPLLERLRAMVRDETVETSVRQRCNVLFRQWHLAYKGTAGLSQIASLHSALPRTQGAASSSAYSTRRNTADGAEYQSSSASHSRSASGANATPPRPKPMPTPSSNTPHSSSSIFSSRKKERPRTDFNLEKERSTITQTIAQSSIASTNLVNSLKFINHQTQNVSESSEVKERVSLCKILRKQLLRYIQLVESDELIGSLLSANDELNKALTAYDVMDKGVDDDSDSDEYESHTTPTLNKLSLSPTPPRPNRVIRPGNIDLPEPDIADREDESSQDEQNPFGDSNAVKTPSNERPGMTWKTV